ncbi:MAG: gliding motility lipoprotein GldD [Flavobacteriales bacterium]|nr:MAG: gliding motility lipoprotein GldD [Flavobacteriales bacterium]
MITVTRKLYHIILKAATLIVVIITMISCHDDVFPKPKAYLNLEYPPADYQRFINNCPYSFYLSKAASIHFIKGCHAEVDYPKLKAKIHITYRPVQNNLKDILREADKLTTKHTVKASAIVPRLYENKSTKVYGVLNEVQGESASNVQFYATDSIHHVLTAALYFDVKPNYDSLYPVVEYLKKDMMTMLETIEWKDQ